MGITLLISNGSRFDVLYAVPSTCVLLEWATEKIWGVIDNGFQPPPSAGQARGTVGHHRHRPPCLVLVTHWSICHRAQYIEAFYLSASYNTASGYRGKYLVVHHVYRDRRGSWRLVLPSIQYPGIDN